MLRDLLHHLRRGHGTRRASDTHDVEAGPDARRPAASGFGPTVDAQLTRDGYARLGRLLSPEQCSRLYDAFDMSLQIAGRSAGSNWWPSITLPVPAARAFIDHAIRSEILGELSTKYDTDLLEPVRFDYSVKPPGTDTELGPHQDYSVVDERRWNSYYFWIPLVDTNEQNGTLHVLPGSHRYTNCVRSFHVPSRFDPVIPQIKEQSVQLDCAAGELVIMVSGVVHFSPVNRTDQVRLAAHGILKPIDAALVFFHASDDAPTTPVEMYEVDIDHYIGMLLGQPPDPGRRRGTVNREPGEMSRERFERGVRSIQ